MNYHYTRVLFGLLMGTLIVQAQANDTFKKTHQHYMQSTKFLNQCIEDSEKHEFVKRELDNLYINHCQMDPNAPEHFEDSIDLLYRSVDEAALEKYRVHFHRDMVRQSILNTIQGELYTRYYYDPSFAKDGQVSNQELQKLYDKACMSRENSMRGQDMCHKLNRKGEKPSFPEILKKHLRVQRNLIHHYRMQCEQKKVDPCPMRKLSKRELLGEVNSSVDELNSMLDEIPLDGKNKEAVKNSEAFQEKLGHYQTAYNEILNTSHTGALLLTSHAQNELDSAPKNTDTALGQKRGRNKAKGSKFFINKHKEFGPKDLDDSINEMKSSFGDELKRLHSLATSYGSNSKKLSNEKLKKQIREMVAYNPRAIGPVLLSNPEYSMVVCQSVNHIGFVDYVREQYQPYIKNAGLVGAGLAVVGGAAMIFGAPITAAGAVILGTASGSLMAPEVSLNATDAWQSRERVQLYQQSMLSGNQSKLDAISLNNQMEDYTQKRNQALLDLGMLAGGEIFIAGSKVVGSFLRNKKLVSQSGKVDQVDNAVHRDPQKAALDDEILRIKMPKLSKDMQVAFKQGDYNLTNVFKSPKEMDDFAQFFDHMLINTSDKAINKFLTMVRTRSFSDDQLKLIVQKSIKACP